MQLADLLMLFIFDFKFTRPQEKKLVLIPLCSHLFIVKWYILKAMAACNNDENNVNNNEVKNKNTLHL